MLYFKCFICSLFLWLSFGTPQNFNGVPSTIDSKIDIISTTNENNRQALIVDGHLKTYQANWSLKIFKTPVTLGNNKVSLPTAETYNYKLLYLAISETVPLKLTSSKRIFPFHCFT